MIVMICFIVHCVSSCVHTRVYLSTEFMTCIFVLFKDAIRFIHLLHAIYQEPSSTGTTSKAVPQLLYVV